MIKPIASLSLDLDDLWSYQRTHGDPNWEQRASYLPELVTPMLDLLDEAGCKTTVFVVGADAAVPANAEWLRMITARGHEVGNHSFRHECWLHLYTRNQLEEDLVRAEEAICSATGQRPLGFRGPGFSWSPQLLEVLAERGYLYDASTLPTYIAPLARAYFLATARISAEQRRQRRELFGSFRDGFRPVGAYWWQLSSGRRLLEIPVTTIPIVKLPFHMSYLIYLSRFSRPLMEGYLRVAIEMCRRMGVTPSFLLHPLDFLGAEQARQLMFFPGMDVSGADKRALVRRVLRTLAQHFTLVPMSAHAAHGLAQDRLAVIEPARHIVRDTRTSNEPAVASRSARRSAGEATANPNVMPEPPL
jgi:peptidoglycan/xylan/chitin deacetylase (PgdA/CDA1 family)